MRRTHSAEACPRSPDVAIPVFWLTPTNRVRVSLRRYSAGDAVTCPKMPGKYSYHNASVDIGTAAPKWTREKEGRRFRRYLTSPRKKPRTDPRWPKRCACGYRFKATDQWQTNGDLLYSGAPDGKLYTLRDAPAGAMWDAWWLNDMEMFTGPDGLALMVRTPGGDWNVDGEASNCTRTQYGPKVIKGIRHEKVWLGRTHYCWIRQGDPRRPATVHVDKNGQTCAAGAGSIQAGSYHGFLHHGHLT